MTCIAVPEAHPDHDPGFFIADRILASLAEVDVATLTDATGNRSRPRR